MKVSIRFMAVLLAGFSFNPTLSQARGVPLNETYHIGVFSGSIDNGAQYGNVTADGFVLSARNNKMSLDFVKFSSDDGDISTGGTWTTEGQGVFLALLGQGNPYMKFRVGSISQDTTETISGVDTISDSSITSYGLGFGYKLGTQGIIEFDIISLDGNASFATLSIMY